MFRECSAAFFGASRLLRGLDPSSPASSLRGYGSGGLASVDFRRLNFLRKDRTPIFSCVSRGLSPKLPFETGNEFFVFFFVFFCFFPPPRVVAFSADSSRERAKRYVIFSFFSVFFSPGYFLLEALSPPFWILIALLPCGPPFLCYGLFSSLQLGGSVGFAGPSPTKREGSSWAVSLFPALVFLFPSGICFLRSAVLRAVYAWKTF